MKHETISSAMSNACYNEIVKLVYRHTGITIAKDRRSMLSSRLRSRLREKGLTSFDAYIDLLKTDTAETVHFVNSVTTNETYFYRTPRVWEHFTGEFVPDWIEKNKNRRMQVWSAASSTGEEAHTVGIMLDSIRADSPGFDFAVLGTDISTRVTEVASAGKYNGRSLSRFRTAEPEKFAKYLIGDDQNGYVVDQSVRSKLKFKNHNLLKRPSFPGKFDAVFLRNALIYFTAADQEQILQNVYRAISPEGVLYLGESENISQLHTQFEPVAPLTYRPVPMQASI